MVRQIRDGWMAVHRGELTFTMHRTTGWPILFLAVVIVLFSTDSSIRYISIESPSSTMQLPTPNANPSIRNTLSLSTTSSSDTDPSSVINSTQLRQPLFTKTETPLRAVPFPSRLPSHFPIHPQQQPPEILNSQEEDNNNINSSRIVSERYAQLPTQQQQRVLPVVIDILSIGSRTRPSHQVAQQSTFGTRPSVRHFVSVTEDIDSDQTCASGLPWTSLVRVVLFCRIPKVSHLIPPLGTTTRGGGGTHHKEDPTIQTANAAIARQYSYEHRKRIQPLHKLFKKANPVGWLCAQKRPLEAFYSYMQRYAITTSAAAATTTTSSPDPSTSASGGHASSTTVGNDTIRTTSTSEMWSTVQATEEAHPDYLFIIDDDTFVNLPLVERELQSRFPSTLPYAVAGRLIGSHPLYTYPVGGFGIILTKPVLQNFLMPIYCDNTDVADNVVDEDHKNRTLLICQQISVNAIGERSLFYDGMSILDLMNTYVTRYQYTNVASWQSPGYCMHSDWVWGYFIQKYHMAGVNGRFYPYDVHASINGEGPNKSPYDNMMHNNVKSPCTNTSHLCHYAGPHDMEELYTKTNDEVK